MNPRITTAVIGVVTVGLGLSGLFYPDRVMGMLGFAVLNPAHAAAALGEVRATYGGLFVAMGVYTLLAVPDPVAQRGRLLFIGFLWLGACAGRLVGISVDGNPGVPGWVGVIFELIVGGTLVLTSFAKGSAANRPPA